MHRVRELLARLVGYRAWARRDRELDREIATHLQMAAEDHVRAGMSDAEARAAAIRELGGVVQTKEAFRAQQGFATVGSVARDVSYAWRLALARPSFSAAVLLTIALGVGANTAVFSVARSVLWRPLPFDEPDHLYRLFQAQSAGPTSASLVVELPGLGEALILARRNSGVARLDVRARGIRRQGGDSRRPRDRIVL